MPVFVLYDVVGENGRRSRHAVHVIDHDGTVLLKIPWRQPGNPGHFLQIFEALGME